MRLIRFAVTVIFVLGLAACDEESPSARSADKSESAAENETAGVSTSGDTRSSPSDGPETGSEAAADSVDASNNHDRQTISVFILAGQSNMVGLGEVAELTSNQARSVERVRIWLDDTIHMNPNRKRWGTLAPGFGASGEHFGPELSFGRRLRERWPDRDIAMIKVAEGGTNLHTDWRAREGRLYSRLIEDVRKQMEVLREDWRPRIVGMAWMQGESDAVEGVAESYEENLRTFVKAVRQDLNRPDLPITIGLIAPIELWAKHETIRMAQKSVAASVGGANTVDTAGYSRHPDDPAHYDTEGQLRLGRNFADALLTLQK